MVVIEVTTGPYDQIPRRYEVPGAIFSEVRSNLTSAGVASGVFYVLDPVYGYRVLTHETYAAGAGALFLVDGERRFEVPQYYYGIENRSLRDAYDLLRAAESGQLERVREMIGRGTDLKVVNLQGHTVLMAVIASLNRDIVRELIRAGADIDAEGEDGSTVLMQAVSYNSLEIVQELVDAGATVNAQDQNGDTALHLAVYSCDFSIARYLIDAGANTALQNINGWTAEELARQSGCLPIAEALRTGPIVEIKEPAEAEGERRTQ